MVLDYLYYWYYFCYWVSKLKYLLVNYENKISTDFLEIVQ